MKGNIRQNKTKTMRRVGVFYVLTNSFKLQFNTPKKWLNSHGCFCILCNVISHTLQILESPTVYSRENEI